MSTQSWPSGGRDTTEWPQVRVSVDAKLREHLEEVIKLDGVGWSDFKAMDARAGSPRTPERWRTYRVMYARLGLIGESNGFISLSPLGKAIRDLPQAFENRGRQVEKELAQLAASVLVRYQLNNPVDNFSDLPPDCDVRPYSALWLAALELEGKLHWHELNRIFLKVMRMDELAPAIERARRARAKLGGNYDGAAEKRLDDLLGDPITTDQAPARMAPWFSAAGWGGLLISRDADDEGFRNLTVTGKEILPPILREQPPSFTGTTPEEWSQYYLEPLSRAIHVNPGDSSNQPPELGALVKAFHNCAAECAVQIEEEYPLRFAASLLSKRFLILAGLAGSGKTKMAQAFARWITPQVEVAVPLVPGTTTVPANFYEVIPVGADWTGNENILGYPDGLRADHYVAKPALSLILHAASQVGVPHFLILDEMNLSHVERYFADLLSVIESDEGLELYSGATEKPETWRRTSAGQPVPPKLKQLPPNLFVVGTVNVDETTYMFSPKVLDRANVIEFRMDASGIVRFLRDLTKPDLSQIDGKGESFGRAFVHAANSRTAISPDVKPAYDAEMVLFFKTLQPHGAEFGYRTAYEASRFIHFYKILGNHRDGSISWFPSAFDCVIFQKLLPKLHGSRGKLGPLLKKLWFLCVNDEAGRGKAALNAAEEAARSTDKSAEPSAILPNVSPYPLSAAKISRMWRLLMENGFASFAEA